MIVDSIAYPAFESSTQREVTFPLLLQSLVDHRCRHDCEWNRVRRAQSVQTGREYSMAAGLEQFLLFQSSHHPTCRLASFSSVSRPSVRLRCRVFGSVFSCRTCLFNCFIDVFFLLLFKMVQQRIQKKPLKILSAEALK